MPATISLMLWGIEATHPFSPPTTVNEKLARAIRLGGLVNACDWSWRQGWLTTLPGAIEAGGGALNAILDAVPQDHSNSAESLALLQRAQRLFDDYFKDQCCPIHEVRSLRLWEAYRDMHPRDIVVLLASQREWQLKQFLVLFEDIPDACRAILDEREASAFNLGVALDRGVRPLGVHHHVYVPSESPEVGVYDPLSAAPPPPPDVPRKHPPYLGNYCVVPGEVAPETDWPVEVAVRWRGVFGDSAELDSCMKDVRNYLVDASGRRELVSRLFSLSMGPSRFVIATTPAATGPVLTDSSTFATPDPRTELSRLGASVLTREEVGKVGLRFVERGKTLKVFNTDGKDTDFSSHPTAYRVVRYLADQLGELGRSRLCTTEQIFFAAWGESSELIPKKNVPTQISHARTLLSKIGWGIENAKSDTGYVLYERPRTQE